MVCVLILVKCLKLKYNHTMAKVFSSLLWNLNCRLVKFTVNDSYYTDISNVKNPVFIIKYNLHLLCEEIQYLTYTRSELLIKI